MRIRLGLGWWLGAVIVSLGALGSLGCGDDACRSSDECGSGEECGTPSDVPVCGIPCRVERACEAATCGTGMACTDYVGSCCAPWDELSSQCVTACTATSCGDGERCGASGACEPTPCADGFACPSQWRCVATGAGVDRHGCQRIPCTSDDTCTGSGVCVNGQCRDSLGTCVVPMAVP